jgi:hypothetical protein
MSTNDISILKETLSQVLAEQKSMRELFVGNPLDEDDKGLLGDIREMRKEIDTLKDFKKKVINWSLGVVFAGGIFFGIIQLIVNYIANHNR